MSCGDMRRGVPHAVFELLVIAAESFIKIKEVNKDHIERNTNTLMIMFNKQGVYGPQPKHSEVAVMHHHRNKGEL